MFYLSYLGQFKDEVDSLLVLVNLLQVDDVWMVQGRHDLDLAVDQPSEVFVLAGKGLGLHISKDKNELELGWHKGPASLKLESQLRP